MNMRFEFDTPENAAFAAIFLMNSSFFGISDCIALPKMNFVNVQGRNDVHKIVCGLRGFVSSSKANAL